MFAFSLSPNEEQIQVNHKDGNPGNNHISNLEGCTSKENIQHALKVLGRKFGARNGKGHPTDQANPTAKEYEVVHPCGKVENIFNMAEFCRKHSIHPGSIANVVNGKRTHHKGYKVCRLST